MKKYQYQIVRYVHDHFTGEYVNVGVVVYSREDSFLACKITGKYKRITDMFPGVNGRWVLKVLNNFNTSLDRISKELNELFLPSDSLEQLTNSILIRDNNAIQLTMVKMAIDINLQSALEDLYNSQVEKYNVSVQEKDTLLDDEVWKTKYKSYFEKYGIDKKLVLHKVNVPKDVISFDKSWKNEIWHSYEPLSFVLKESDSIKDKVYKWAGKLQGLLQSNEPLHLTLLTSLPSKHSNMKGFIDEYLKVKSYKLTVEIVSDHEAENLAIKIKEQMEMHENN